MLVELTVSARTFAILKPDAVAQGAVGAILIMAKSAGLRPIWMLMPQQPIPEVFWASFYKEHQGKPFYDELIEFMTSGPCVFLVLEHAEGGDAIAAWRKLMGATMPADREPETIRHTWGADGPRTVVHGSDSRESYERERDLARVNLYLYASTYQAPWG